MIMIRSTESNQHCPKTKRGLIKEAKDYVHRIKAKMSESICQTAQESVSRNLTPTRQREDYKSFYLKKTTWEAIRVSRGWKEYGSISRLAEELRITRQYATDIVHCNCGCSSNVIRRIVDLLGIREGCWCHLFDKTNLREASPNHPIFNQMKYDGEVPYERYSPSAEAKAGDYKVEKSIS